MSSSAWVGCSFVPSPALMTEALTCLAIRCGAPVIGCRRIITSVPMTSSVRAVSIRVSPLATLDAEAVIPEAVPDRYLQASSKDRRVRVLFS